MSRLEIIKEAVINGRATEVKENTEKALDEGLDVGTIVNEAFIPGMNEIGIMFKNNEVYVPEMLIAARAMQAGMKVVKPLLTKSDIKDKGTVAIGTVKGDLHDIGKNLVAMMFEGAGFKIIDMGVDVSAEKVTQVVNEYNPQIICLSALLTTTMTNMKAITEHIKTMGNQIRVMVGGAPVTQKFADEIGADGYAADAPSAVDKAKELLAVVG